MRRKGVSFAARPMQKVEFRTELLKKVGEEASALPHLKSAKEIVAELADVLDVVDAVRREFGITSTEITKARKENTVKKGGFAKRVYLEWSEDSGYTTNERKGVK